MTKPLNKPSSPCFSCGPTRKRPNWNVGNLNQALLGRMHLSPEGRAKLKEVITLTRDVHEIPVDHSIVIIPGSATGAIECALWSLLGSRGVDVFYWDFFGSLWATDIVDQLKLVDTRVYSASFGDLPDLYQYDSDRDAVFTWNGTSSGVCVPNLDWICDDRQGLTICDATSAAFCVDLEWSKLDVVAFSWQKGLGSEAGYGMLVLSPRAIKRLECFKPSHPIPRIFRLWDDKGILLEDVYEGRTLNTPSMLCIEDYLDALRWAKDIGGLPTLMARCAANFSVVDSWVERTPWIRYLAKDPATRSPTSVCFELIDDSGDLLDVALSQTIIVSIEKLLAEEKVAYDIRNHRSASPSLRIWIGPTIETDDLEALFPWIEWAYTQSI